MPVFSKVKITSHKEVLNKKSNWLIFLALENLEGNKIDNTYAYSYLILKTDCSIVGTYRPTTLFSIYKHLLSVFRSLLYAQIISMDFQILMKYFWLLIEKWS